MPNDASRRRYTRLRRSKACRAQRRAVHATRNIYVRSCIYIDIIKINVRLSVSRVSSNYTERISSRVSLTDVFYDEGLKWVYSCNFYRLFIGSHAENDFVLFDCLFVFIAVCDEFRSE